MSHDRSHDPATSETSQPADNISSSTLQLADSEPSVDAQSWEGDPLNTDFLQQYEPWSSYAVDPLAPISAYNSISEDVIVSNGSFIQRDSASLAEPPDAFGYASLQRWDALDPAEWSGTFSMGELPYLGIEGEKDGSKSPVVHHGFLGPGPPLMSDESESWMTSDVLLYCPFDGCSAAFRGDYKRGNLGRHRRMKHNGQHIAYRCEASDCPKSFLRTDARKKHYRKHHPELASGFPVLRRSDSRVGCPKENFDRSDETRGAEYGVSATTGISVTTPIVPAADELHYAEEASSPAATLLSGALPQKSHENGESVQCDICKKTFGRAAELRRHNMSFHDSNTPEFYCEVPGCPRGIDPFARKDKLRDHIDKMHAPPTTTEASEADEEDMEIIHSCPEDGCDKVFDHKAGLLRHQRTHTAKSERKHKCSQCDESFLYPKDLKRHEATHLNDGDKNKPSFYCEVASCEYGPGSQGFSRKDALLRHIKKLHPD